MIVTIILQSSDIRETLVVTHLVISNLSEGIAQFQLVQPAYMVFNKFLIGHHPSESHSRKKTEALIFFEVFRTGISEIKFGKITFVIGISSPAGESRIAVWHSLENIFRRVL